MALNEPHSFVTDSEEVSTEEGQAMSTQLDLTYFKCLPTNSKQIEEIFQFLVQKIVSTYKKE